MIWYLTYLWRRRALSWDNNIKARARKQDRLVSTAIFLFQQNITPLSWLLIIRIRTIRRRRSRWVLFGAVKGRPRIVGKIYVTQFKPQILTAKLQIIISNRPTTMPSSPRPINPPRATSLVLPRWNFSLSQNFQSIYSKRYGPWLTKIQRITHSIKRSFL